MSGEDGERQAVIVAIPEIEPVVARVRWQRDRLYGIGENGEFAYAEERALRGLPMKPHLSAQLARIAC